MIAKLNSNATDVDSYSSSYSRTLEDYDPHTLALELSGGKIKVKCCKAKVSFSARGIVLLTGIQFMRGVSNWVFYPLGIFL